MRTKRLSRRTLLRGLAAGTTVGLGLPLLEAMIPSARAEPGDLEPPIFGIFFWGGGVPWHGAHGHPDRADLWTPAATGEGFAPSELLEPLAGRPFSVVTGLEPRTEVPGSPSGQNDGHMRGFMVAMTSDRPRPEDFDHGTHTLTALRPTLDQFVAKHDDYYGDAVPSYRSVHVGVSRARFHDYGHWNAISYNGPESQNLPVMDPAELFGLLFDLGGVDVEELRTRANLLDAVLEDAARLRTRLGQSDRQRLDEHLEHVDQLQRRLEQGAVLCATPDAPANPDDLLGRTAVMGELLAAALACGLTRVFTVQLTSPATVDPFYELGIGNAMHDLCHSGAWNNVRAITHYQMQAFATLLDRLAAVTLPQGGTLLDEACIFGTSEYGEGNTHSVAEMPCIIAGHAGGALRSGVHVRRPGETMSKAHLTILQSLGLDVPSYGFNGGETSEVLGELLA